ncbi:iron complex transport system permease protein [Kutzneria viridogrisea]|uniref:Iron complex transport system permease protein n=1 Tax=Kutzneria viridogrisea TaxID=47990 RepID=A0ABR6BXA2_9PSEU|nr:iron ABC transporter permease [Kutzneria albida]MBA8931237.1 iron complex transport system permease protein [Kutzneria viridogrisea]
MTASTALTERRRRRVLGLVLLLLGVVAASLASIAIGSKSIPLDAVWHGLVAPGGSENDIIVRALRVPRTELALLVGAALGIAGSLIQGHTRNPLADPGLLGVSSGAAFAVVVGIFGFGLTSLYAYVWLAFLGAMVTTALVFLLGSAGRGGPTPLTLALAGAAVTALMQGLISALVVLDQQSLDAYRFWRVGAVAGRDSVIIGQVLPFLLLGAVLAFANAPGLNALSLGEDVARSIGQHVRRTRVLGIAAITLLTGGAVAACGPIAFVGLIVPHVARAITGPDYRWLLPYSALIGMVLMLVSDIIGRVIAWPGELQVGIVLAMIGAPVFIAIVRRRRLTRL